MWKPSPCWTYCQLFHACSQQDFGAPGGDRPVVTAVVTGWRLGGDSGRFLATADTLADGVTAGGGEVVVSWPTMSVCGCGCVCVCVCPCGGQSGSLVPVFAASPYFSVRTMYHHQ